MIVNRDRMVNGRGEKERKDEALTLTKITALVVYRMGSGSTYTLTTVNPSFAAALSSLASPPTNVLPLG